MTTKSINLPAAMFLQTRETSDLKQFEANNQADGLLWFDR